MAASYLVTPYFLRLSSFCKQYLPPPVLSTLRLVTSLVSYRYLKTPHPAHLCPRLEGHWFYQGAGHAKPQSLLSASTPHGLRTTDKTHFMMPIGFYTDVHYLITVIFQYCLAELVSTSAWCLSEITPNLLHSPTLAPFSPPATSPHIY